MKWTVKALVVLGPVLLLMSCNGMLRAIYPSQTANAVTFSIATNDANVTAANYRSLQLYVSLYQSNSDYPLATYNSGLTYNSVANDYTGTITLGGLEDGSYYALIWLDLNGDGVWDNNEPYYLTSNFNLYGAQTLTTPVSVP